MSDINKSERTLGAMICGGEYEELRKYLDAYNIDLNQYGENTQGETYLQYSMNMSCQHGTSRFKIVRLLVEKGADVNYTSPTNITPLMMAASMLYVDVVDYLITMGADVNAKDIRGYTALMYIGGGLQNNDVLIAKRLVEAGAHVKYKAQNGMTAEDIAKELGNDSLRIFLERERGKEESNHKKGDGGK